MRPSRPLLRLISLAAAVAAALLAAPAAQAQDCLLPGSEEYATQPVCNLPPMVTLTPPSTSVGQPQVPVTLEASDHYSDNDFASFQILLDGQDVTQQWSVTVTEGGWGTGTSKTFRASGTVALSATQAQRSLQVRLCDTEWCETASSTFTLRRPGVEVTPDGQPPSGAASGTVPFTVKNTGITSASFSLTAECRDPLGQPVAPCGVQPSVAMGAGASAAVSASYPLPTAGSMVTVMVRAQQQGEPGVQDAGWTDVAAESTPGQTAAAPQVALVPLNAGAAIERSQCVTVATAPGSAYECGDLRVAHALPAHRTRGRMWAPVLLYNSQHAHPRPVVHADVTLPAGSAIPASVEMVVTMADGTIHRATFAGSDFVPGVPRRIGVQWDAIFMETGLYAYQVQVISHYSGGSLASAQYPGEMTIVNRAGSPFGAGWWLAGLDRLYCIDCSTGGSRTLWVGGDGSTRVYEPTVPGAWYKWVAQNPGGAPDTLELLGSEYVRKLPGGGRVHYDGFGKHVKTVNRLGQASQFTYGTHGPAGVYVPGNGAGGPGTGDPAWIMNWDGAAQLIRSISATLQGAPTRTTSLTIDGNRRVTAITDPDTRSVGFDYHPAAYLRPAAQRDRRGTWTFYGYDGAGKLSSARTQLGSTANPAVDPTTGFVAAEGAGVAWRDATGAASAAALQAHTRIDGPRTDVNDVTVLWLSSTGAVRRARDALGAETYIQHDARFAALPTRVLAPGGRVTRAHYDARGRVDTATVENVLGDGRDHVTVYAYDDRWDKPASVASYQVYPGSTWTLLSARDTMVYDAASGNVLWTQKGSDAARRVTYTYYTSGAAAGLLASARAPSSVPGQTARDSLLYDARGNLRLTVSPLGFLTLHERDVLGRDTLTVTPTTAAGATTEANLLATGVRQRTRYDVMDRPTHTWTIGPAVSHDSPGGLVPWSSGSDTLFVVTEYDGGGLPLQVTRWASPDTARVHTLITTYTYDAAGRKETESDGFVTQTYGYDPAGNVRTWTTPRGHQITSEYDALNRLVRRVVPGVTYARACADGGTSCPDPYPHHPNGSAGSLVIPEEWTTFRFDALGNMVHAENGDAIVRRGYYPNGALKTDSLRIRSLNGVDFNANVYGLAYGYDLAGRTTSMQHPQNLAGSQALDQYGYHPITGALATMTARTGHAFNFTYAHNGQMVRLNGPAYADTMVYDLEGRLVRRIETASVAGVLHSDSLMYDARGKLMQVNVGATTNRGASWYRQFYSGSGMLIATDWRNEMDAGRVQEAFAMDAMGNTAWRRAGDGSSSAPDSLFRNAYDFGRGRLATIDKLNMGVPSLDFEPNRTERRYDASGNVDWAFFEQTGNLGDDQYNTIRWKGSRSFYAADERLRYFQERDLRGGTTVKRDGVWEEYRYDPLGRRILVNTRTKDLCTTGTAFQCASATTRMVWAGDQLIWELRQASQSPGETSGPSDAYGTVSYMHAGGIDRPLVITKNGQSVLPHQNWRGQFSRGTYASGASSDCAPGQTYNCAKIAWPGWRTTAWHVDAKDPDIRTWWGGLVDGMRDVSGQMYMRNRYYDPATGQFTQTDPIGIAGGLNVYGFANGDPISYSDPYGLSSTCDPPRRPCPTQVSQNTSDDDSPPGRLNPVKGFVGVTNMVSGGTKTAAGILTGNPLAIGLGLSNLNRGGQQVGEAVNDPAGPSPKNVLGLLPFGQKYDDTIEPGPVEYFMGLYRDVKRDPRGAIQRAVEDFFAL